MRNDDDQQWQQHIQRLEQRWNTPRHEWSIEQWDEQWDEWFKRKETGNSDSVVSKLRAAIQAAEARVRLAERESESLRKRKEQLTKSIDQLQKELSAPRYQDLRLIAALKNHF